METSSGKRLSRWGEGSPVTFSHGPRPHRLLPKVSSPGLLACFSSVLGPVKLRMSNEEVISERDKQLSNRQVSKTEVLDPSKTT